MMAVGMYVVNTLGRMYTECLRSDFGELLEDAGPCTPMLLQLSSGVDPAPKLQAFAAAKGMTGKFQSVALGQGQVIPPTLLSL